MLIACSQLAEVNQLYAGRFERRSNFRCGEGGEFFFPALLEAGGSAEEKVATTAGVAHEFGASLRKDAQQLHELAGAETAGDLEARKVIGRAAMVSLQSAKKAAAQEPQCCAGQFLKTRDGSFPGL